MDRVEIRMTPDQHEALEALARAKGQKVAAYVRAAINAYAGEEVFSPVLLGRPWPKGYRGRAAAQRAARLEALEARIEKLRATRASSSYP